MQPMVLVYLPTKLGDFVRANVGKYTSIFRYVDGYNCATIRKLPLPSGRRLQFANFHYFYDHFQEQTVSLPEGIVNFTFNHQQTQNLSDYNYIGILMDMLEFYPGFYNALRYANPFL